MADLDEALGLTDDGPAYEPPPPPTRQEIAAERRARRRRHRRRRLRRLPIVGRFWSTRPDVDR